jgi:hypothetical protein
MRNRSSIDSIDDYKSVVYLSIYRGGGLDPLQTNFRAYPEILANKHSKKLGTLICFALVRTIWPTGADRPPLILVPSTNVSKLYILFTKTLKIQFIYMVCMNGTISRLRELCLRRSLTKICLLYYFLHMSFYTS